MPDICPKCFNADPALIDKVDIYVRYCLICSKEWIRVQEKK